MALVIASNVFAAYIHNTNYKFTSTSVIDEFSVYTIILLLISGFIIRGICDFKALFVFIVSFLSMIVVAIIEISINKYTHNLLPFEVLICCPYVAIFPTTSYAISIYVIKMLHRY